MGIKVKFTQEQQGYTEVQDEDVLVYYLEGEGFLPNPAGSDRRYFEKVVERYSSFSNKPMTVVLRIYLDVAPQVAKRINIKWRVKRKQEGEQNP